MSPKTSFSSDFSGNFLSANPADIALDGRSRNCAQLRDWLVTDDASGRFADSAGSPSARLCDWKSRSHKDGSMLAVVARGAGSGGSTRWRATSPELKKPKPRYRGAPRATQVAGAELFEVSAAIAMNKQPRAIVMNANAGCAGSIVPRRSTKRQSLTEIVADGHARATSSGRSTILTGTIMSGL